MTAGTQLGGGSAGGVRHQRLSDADSDEESAGTPAKASNLNPAGVKSTMQRLQVGCNRVPSLRHRAWMGPAQSCVACWTLPVGETLMYHWEGH